MADGIPSISTLIAARDGARERFFAHRDPGNLTPPQKTAFKYRNMAMLLWLKAAQIELEAELELCAMLEQETAHD